MNPWSSSNGDSPRSSYFPVQNSHRRQPARTPVTSRTTPAATISTTPTVVLGEAAAAARTRGARTNTGRTSTTGGIFPRGVYFPSGNNQHDVHDAEINPTFLLPSSRIVVSSRPRCPFNEATNCRQLQQHQQDIIIRNLMIAQADRQHHHPRRSALDTTRRMMIGGEQQGSAGAGNEDAGHGMQQNVLLRQLYCQQQQCYDNTRSIDEDHYPPPRGSLFNPSSASPQLRTSNSTTSHRVAAGRQFAGHHHEQQQPSFVYGSGDAEIKLHRQKQNSDTTSSEAKKVSDNRNPQTANAFDVNVNTSNYAGGGTCSADRIGDARHQSMHNSFSCRGNTRTSSALLPASADMMGAYDRGTRLRLLVARSDSDTAAMPSRMAHTGNICASSAPSNMILGLRRNTGDFRSSDQYTNSNLIGNAAHSASEERNDLEGEGEGLLFADRAARVVLATSTPLICQQDLRTMQQDSRGASTITNLGSNTFHEQQSSRMSIQRARDHTRYFYPADTGGSFSNIQSGLHQRRELLSLPSNLRDVAPAFLSNQRFNSSNADDRLVSENGPAMYNSRVSLNSEEDTRCWMTQFDALKMFKEEFGHCNVPSYFKANPPLGQFVHKQRQLYRQYKSKKGDESCYLKSFQVKLLEDIGFACRKKPGVLWMAQFSLLKKFEEEHGHVHVPMHYKKDKRLGHWVNNQRQLYRKYKAGLPTSMNESRIELLEAMSFAWVLGKDWKEKRKIAIDNITIGSESPSSAAETNIDDKETTTETVASLKKNAFDETHDTVEISNAYGSSSYHKDDSNDTPIPGDSEDKDNDIRTFSLEPEDEGEQQPASTKRKQRSESSDTRFEDQERSFTSSQKEKCKIPRVEVDDGRTLSHVLFVSKAGDYDSDISTRNFDEGMNSDIDNDSSHERKKRISRNCYNTDKHWNKQFEDLSTFKAINGHMNIPYYYPENKTLRYWVTDQRLKYRQFVKAQQTTLTRERIDALKSIGFMFNERDINDDTMTENMSIPLRTANGSSKHISSAQTKSLWNVRMNELKEYEESYGNCLVPALYLPNMALGTWVIHQRQQYSKFQNGKISSLTYDKMKQLELVGFKIVSRPFIENKIGLVKEDVIGRILSFVLDVGDVVSFFSTSKHYFSMMHNVEFSNEVFLQCFNHKYGGQRLLGLAEYEVSDNLSWLDAWKEVPKFEKALGLQTNLDEGDLMFTNPSDEATIHEENSNSISILSRREEHQALLTDNVDLVPVNDPKKHCSGYGGMVLFYAQLLPTTANGNSASEPTYKEQFAIWGDFNGLRVIDTLDDLFSNDRSKTLSVGESKFGFVSTAISGPQFLMTHKRTYHPRRPCVYIGCDSGAIVGICPLPKDNNSIAEYGVSSMTYSHSSGVKAFCLLIASKVVGGSDVLISAGEDGKVIAYPNSFSARSHQFELHTHTTCFKNNAPITALASSEIDSNLFIFTGDVAGKIIMWKLRMSASRVKMEFKFDPIFKLPPLDAGAKITQLDLFTNNILVSGSTSGDVQVWDVVEKKTYSIKHRKVAHNPNARHRISQRLLIPIAHSGKITSLSFLGGVLLTTGGNDGVTKAWSISYGDGHLVGTIKSCQGVKSAQLLSQADLGHTERRVCSYEGRSAVLNNIIIGCSMISFCRDGGLYRWRYGDLLEQKLIVPEEVLGGSEVSTIISKKCGNCESLIPEGAGFCDSCLDDSFATDKHNTELEGSESDGSDESDSDSDCYWNCAQCYIPNTTSFTRCSACFAWRSN